jgi:hypothetical protein
MVDLSAICIVSKSDLEEAARRLDALPIMHSSMDCLGKSRKQKREFKPTSPVCAIYNR